MRSIQGLFVIFLAPNFFLAQSPPDTIWTRVLGGEEEERAYSARQTEDGGIIIAGLRHYSGLRGTDALLIKADKEGVPLWIKTYGGGSYEYARYVIEYSGGGYVFAGSAPSSVNNSADLYLVKTDDSGEVEFWRTYNRNYDAEARGVVETDDGGLLVIGMEIWASPGGGGCRDFIVGTDSTGDTLWTKSYLGGVPGPLWTYTCAYPRSLDKTEDGGVIITGSNYEDSVYLMKITSGGDSLWTRNLYEGEGTSVKTTTDGGFIVAGHTYDAQRSNEVLLIKTDSQGNEMWVRTFGTESDDEAYSVDQCNDGGFIIVGSTGDWPAKDLYLLRTDAAGDSLWTKVMGGQELDEGRSIQQTEDGGYIIAGSTRSFGAGSSDVWLIRLRTDLSVQEIESDLPERFSLAQPYPNPFNPTTTIEFSVPQAGLVTLTMYDLLGREVETILNRHMGPGHHKVKWNASEVPSGIYFVRMQARSGQGFSRTRKVTVLR